MKYINAAAAQRWEQWVISIPADPDMVKYHAVMVDYATKVVTMAEGAVAAEYCGAPRAVQKALVRAEEIFGVSGSMAEQAEAMLRDVWVFGEFVVKSR
mgnify:CR=1 FL=1